jgi:UDP-N-acetylmuramate dehydrogenase
VRLLGGGSNVLVRDNGFAGVVVQLRGPGFEQATIDGTSVTVGGGASLPRLVMTCARRGLGGLAGLAGVPGSVGGALRMNAGGRHGDIGRWVEWVDVVDRNGAFRRLAGAEAGFTYRNSALRDLIVVACGLELPAQDRGELLRQVKDFTRAKAAAQPMGARSAGCVFKNPPGDAAGRLIDGVGAKGWRRGDAVISGRHANFIVNEGGATAAEVLGLADDVRRAVRERHGLNLEYEIDIWKEAA